MFDECTAHSLPLMRRLDGQRGKNCAALLFCRSMGGLLGLSLIDKAFYCFKDICVSITSGKTKHQGKHPIY